MIDADDDFFEYSNLIADLGSKYANCDEYGYHIEFVCVVLNRMNNAESYSFIIDINGNTVISIKGRPNVIFGSFQSDDYLEQIYEFFQNEILLFKLESIK